MKDDVILAMIGVQNLQSIAVIVMTKYIHLTLIHSFLTI